jgi:hypothetical protein
MGTWGYNAFQNDEAGDWQDTLKQAGYRSIESAFDAVLGNDGYLEAPECQSAIAAAETLCVVLGRPGEFVPDEVRKWASEQNIPTPELVSTAKKCLERILAGSELKELWDESPKANIWESSVLDTVRRLN